MRIRYQHDTAAFGLVINWSSTLLVIGLVIKLA
jgi:hypothetical protein